MERVVGALPRGCAVVPTLAQAQGPWWVVKGTCGVGVGWWVGSVPGTSLAVEAQEPGTESSREHHREVSAAGVEPL